MFEKIQFFNEYTMSAITLYGFIYGWIIGLSNHIKYLASLIYSHLEYKQNIMRRFFDVVWMMPIAYISLSYMLGKY